MSNLLLRFFLLKLILSSCIEYCNRKNIYFGEWEYREPTIIHKNPYLSCPRTLKRVLNNFMINNQPDAYSCVNKTYLPAKYIPISKCFIRSIVSSLHLLSKRKRQIYFVGDSLMSQLYIAFLCNSEIYGYFDKISTTLIFDTFLRPDIPCDPRCLSDKHFLEQEHKKGIHQMCWSCADGVFNEFNESFATMKKFWPGRVRSDGTNLVIGTGAWYNSYRKFIQPDYYYNETLDRIIPILEDIIQTSNISTVHWLDLPPMKPIPPQTDIFGRNNFITFNKYAELKFSNTNITYLNTANATKQRKFHDLNITDKFRLHWCNPGHDMIPTFQIQTYLHLMLLGL